MLEKTGFHFIGKTFWLGLALALSCSPKVGTNLNIDFTEVDQLIRANQLDRSTAMLDEMLVKQPKNASIWYRKGAIQYQLKRYALADSLLYKATELSAYSNEEHMYSALLAADANDNFQRAIDLEARYRRLGEHSPQRNTKVSSILDRARRLKAFMSEATDAVALPISGVVNTSLHEYLPGLGIKGDKMYFIRRENRKEVIYEALGNYESWDSSRRAGLWEDLPNAGAFSISGDGLRAVITLCGASNGYGSCDLYLRKRKGDAWSDLMNMGDVINSRSWDSQPCFSADGKTLFFSSDRPGGYGGRDLYYVNIQNGVWSEPVNMGPRINTKGNEESPFLHADGTSFYFRSDSWPGMGEYDIFMTRLIPRKWTAIQSPVNLGFPINSTKDDGAFTLAPDGKTAYITSDRHKRTGETPPDLDILGFLLPDSVAAVPTTWIDLRIFDQSTDKEIPAYYELVDLETNELIDSGLYLSWEGVLLPIKTGTNLGLFIEYDNFLPFSSNFRVTDIHDADFPHLIEAGLVPVEKETTFILQNIFFESGLAILLPESYTELRKLRDFLIGHPGSELEVIGHTDDIGNRDDNLKLSLERAKAVVQFLINEGIGPDRLTSQGLGETAPISDNNTEKGRQMNRRTEFRLKLR